MGEISSGPDCHMHRVNPVFTYKFVGGAVEEVFTFSSAQH